VLPATTTSFTFTDREDGVAYHYAVNALNAAGVSSWAYLTNRQFAAEERALEMDGIAGNREAYFNWHFAPEKADDPETGFEYSVDSSGWAPVPTNHIFCPTPDANGTIAPSAAIRKREINRPHELADVDGVRLWGPKYAKESERLYFTFEDIVDINGNVRMYVNDKMVQSAYVTRPPFGESGPRSLTWNIETPMSTTPLEVYVTINGAKSNVWTVLVADQRSCIVEGTNGSPVELAVRWTDPSDGEVLNVDSVIVPIGEPLKPLDVTAERGDNSATFTWDAPASDGGQPITEYQYRITEDGVTGDWVDVDPDSTSVTVPGENGVHMVFELRAVNNIGPSESVVVEVTPAVVPSALVDVTSESRDGGVFFTWQAPESDGGEPITGYEYRADGGDWVTVEPKETDIFVAAPNGTEVSVEVHAVNAVGSGPTTTISGIAQTVPAAVRNLTTTSKDRQVAFTWDAPETDGGNPITGYQFRSTADGSQWITLDPQNTGIQVSGPNGTFITGEVRAITSFGEGPISSATARPYTHADAVRNLAAVETDGQVTFTWDIPAADGGSPVSGYEYTTNDGESWTAATDMTAVIQAPNGTQITFTVRAVTEAGGGTSSTLTASPAARPSAVSDLAAQPSNEKVTFTWAPPADLGGRELVRYEYAVDRNRLAALPADVTSLEVPGYNGELITLKIRAVTSFGAGPVSNVTAAPRTTPSAVSGLAAAPGDNHITVTWDAPESDGGASLTKYEYSIDGGDTWTGNELNTAVEVPVENGTSITVDVRALNGAGAGPASSITQMAHTTPGAPTELAGEPFDSEVSFTWAAPTNTGGLDITGYQVSINGSSWQNVGMTTQYNERGRNGNPITLAVRAINGDGAGAETDLTITPSVAPTQVTIVEVVPFDQRVKFEFSPPTNDGGAPVEFYEASINGGEAFAISPNSTSDGVFTYYVDGENGVEITLGIRAVNQSGGGEWGFMTGAPLGPPTAVRDLAGVPGNETVTYTWDIPQNTGGVKLESYEYRTNGDEWQTLPASATTVTVTGENLTPLPFDIRAINERGAGPITSADVAPAAYTEEPTVQYVSSGTWKITNYNPDYYYEATASAGEATISGDTVSCSAGNCVITLNSSWAKGSPVMSVYMQRMAYTYHRVEHRDCHDNCRTAYQNPDGSWTCQGDGYPAADGTICCGGSAGQTCETHYEDVRNATPAGFTDSGTEWYRQSDLPLAHFDHDQDDVVAEPTQCSVANAQWNTPLTVTPWGPMGDHTVDFTAPEKTDAPVTHYIYTLSDGTSWTEWATIDGGTQASSFNLSNLKPGDYTVVVVAHGNHGYLAAKSATFSVNTGTTEGGIIFSGAAAQPTLEQAPAVEDEADSEREQAPAVEDEADSEREQAPAVEDEADSEREQAPAVEDEAGSEPTT